ncbi:hypothetical protein DEJ39_02565 [Bacteroidetes bacterium SCGC AAA795-G10]|nr:hypothetical protein DEJ39_02565 [Bacteroidetes bacterium SCGC AAA795-G10]
MSVTIFLIGFVITTLFIIGQFKEKQTEDKLRIDYKNYYERYHKERKKNHKQNYTNRYKNLTINILVSLFLGGLQSIRVQRKSQVFKGGI